MPLDKTETIPGYVPVEQEKIEYSCSGCCFQGPPDEEGDTDCTRPFWKDKFPSTAYCTRPFRKDGCNVIFVPETATITEENGHAG